jgi:hypothetical protein
MLVSMARWAVQEKYGCLRRQPPWAALDLVGVGYAETPMSQGRAEAPLPARRRARSKKQ